MANVTSDLFIALVFKVFNYKSIYIYKKKKNNETILCI